MSMYDNYLTYFLFLCWSWLVIFAFSDQIVSVGPESADGQYDYVLLSNWAKYPVFGMARDLESFFATQKTEVENMLRTNGYTNFFTDVMASVSVSDWSFCKHTPTNAGNIAADIVHGILFGSGKRWMFCSKTFTIFGLNVFSLRTVCQSITITFFYLLWMHCRYTVDQLKLKKLTCGFLFLIYKVQM